MCCTMGSTLLYFLKRCTGFFSMMLIIYVPKLHGAVKNPIYCIAWIFPHSEFSGVLISVLAHMDLAHSWAIQDRSGKLYHCLSSDLHLLSCPIQSFSCLKIGHQGVEELPVTDQAPVPRCERPPALRALFPSSLLTDNPQQQPSNSCYTTGTK